MLLSTHGAKATPSRPRLLEQPASRRRQRRRPPHRCGQVAPRLATRPERSAATPACSRNSGSRDPVRSARRAHTSPAPPGARRASAPSPARRPSGCSAPAARRAGRAGPPARRAMVRLEENRLGVRQRPAPAGAAGAGCARPRGRRCAARRSPSACSTSASSVSAVVSGSPSVERRRRAAALRRCPLAASIRASPVRAWGKSGDVAERLAVRARGAAPPAAVELEVAEERLDVGGALRPASRRDREPHRGTAPLDVAVQLAEVGHARVRGEARLQVHEPLDRPRRRGVAAELDLRVGDHRAAAGRGPAPRALASCPAAAARRSRAGTRRACRPRRARRRSRDPSAAPRRRRAPRASRRPGRRSRARGRGRCCRARRSRGRASAGHRAGGEVAPSFSATIATSTATKTARSKAG